MLDSFGLERSIESRHALAQQAWKIDNTMALRPDEVPEKLVVDHVERKK